MKRELFEWLWRVAILAALAWIGWGLQLLHQDLMPQPDDQATAATTGDDTVQASLDELHDDIAGLTQKVDAILVVMARAK